MGFPWWSNGKEPIHQCRKGRFDSWVGKSPGEGNDNPLQYSCLGSLMDRGAWRVGVHRVAELDTAYRLNNKAEPITSCLFSSRLFEKECVNHIKYQIRSVAQSCPTLCDPMNLSMPGLPVHHQLPEFTQTHIHRVSDAIQPSHPQSSPSPLAPNPSQHQSLFQ